MKKAKKPQYSVAMSQQDGCIVIVRTNGEKVSIIGSLTREQSVQFCESVLDYGEPHDPDQPAVRLEYPH